MNQVPEDNYGLDAIARHNAMTSTDRSGPYDSRSNDLDAKYYDFGQSHSHNGGTPRSTTETEGVRTRSGRSTKRNDSPFTNTTSRVSKSPAVWKKKDTKLSKVDKSKTPKLTAPLSVLTKDMEVPMKDMDAWVHRSAEVRVAEVAKRNGYVTRPMNSFMLYRSAFAERTKQWATQNNHQVVSSVAGESWPMEPEEVRNQFNEWARIERANHAAAHPNYKFSPSKTGTKRRKGDFSDDEADGSDLERDPDGEYRSFGGRTIRPRRRHAPIEPAYIEAPVGFDSHPYYDQHGSIYDLHQYPYHSSTRTLPSNVVYDVHGNPYDPHTGVFLQASAHQQAQYQHQYGHDGRTATPTRADYVHNLGGYGIPSTHMSSANVYSTSRTSTPTQLQYYGGYYQQYPHTYHQPPTPVQQHQMLEHRRYLQEASKPQTTMDPALDTVFSIKTEPIDDVLGGTVHDEFTMPEYFGESTSSNQTLAPKWEFSAEELGH